MSTTTTTPTVLQDIENALSADWQKIVSFFNNVDTEIATFLSNVAQGAQILDSDIESVAQTILGKLATINSIVSSVSGAISAVFPTAAPIAATVSAVTGALAQVGNAATAITNGTNPSGTSGVVTDVVNVINQLPTVSNLANQLASEFGALVTASPTATQTTSPPTPNEG